MPKTYTEGDAADVFTNMEPERGSKWAASDPTVNGLEQDLSHYARELRYVIFTANKERNSSWPGFHYFTYSTRFFFQYLT